MALVKRTRKEVAKVSAPMAVVPCLFHTCQQLIEKVTSFGLGHGLNGSGSGIQTSPKAVVEVEKRPSHFKDLGVKQVRNMHSTYAL